MKSDTTVTLPLRRMWERVETTAQESDVAYFYELLHLGELLTKLVVASIVASIDDRDGNRYTLEHDLIRADSLGDWVNKMDESAYRTTKQHDETGGQATRTTTHTKVDKTQRCVAKASLRIPASHLPAD